MSITSASRLARLSSQSIQRTTSTGVTVGITEITSDDDTVEITPPGGSGGNTPPPSSSTTYRPPNFNDRFQFNIENGMFNERLRFNALHSSFGRTASATYNSRQSVAGQVFHTAGGNSTYTAMFDLFYQDSRPNQTSASSHTDALTELNRMADNHFNLLKSI